MRKLIATIAIALAALTTFQGTASAAPMDTDTAVLQTTGGYAKAVVTWNSNRSGTLAVTIRDTVSTGTTCAKLYETTKYVNGTTGSTYVGQACNGGTVTARRPWSTSTGVAKVTFKLVVGSHTDTYSVQPGGA